MISIAHMKFDIKFGKTVTLENKWLANRMEKTNEFKGIQLKKLTIKSWSRKCIYIIQRKILGKFLLLQN